MLPSGLVLNAQIVANASGHHLPVKAIDTEPRTVTLSILDGVQGSNQYFYHLVTDASVPIAAVLEKGVLAPRLAKIPEFGESLPGAKSALLCFSPVLNGRTDKGSGEDQGFSTALGNGGIDPINVFPVGPDNDNPSRENNYSPLWGPHVSMWTQAAVDGEGASHPFDGRAEVAHSGRAPHQCFDQHAGARQPLCRRSAADRRDHKLSGDRATGSAPAIATFVLVLPILFGQDRRLPRTCDAGVMKIGRTASLISDRTATCLSDRFREFDDEIGGGRLASCALSASC